MSELIALLIMIVLVAYVVWPLYRMRSQGLPFYAGLAASSQDLHYQMRIASEIIQDLHFDYQTGKLSDEDHQELVHEQELQIDKIQNSLDKLQSEHTEDLSVRLEAEIAREKTKLVQGDGTTCPRCGKPRPAGARFCPSCGAPLS